MELYALNASTGHIDWSVPFSPQGYSDTAAYDNGQIFIFNNNSSASTMNAYNASNGMLNWSEPLSGQSEFSSPPTAVNGAVYTGGSGYGGTIYAFKESDGTPLWTASTDVGDNSSPAIASNGLYVSYTGPQVYGFNPTSGVQNWHYSGPTNGGGGKTPVYYDSDVYVRNSGTLTTYSAATGALQTSFQLPVSLTAAPAFSNGIGYATGLYSGHNALVAFDPVTGTVLWNQTLNDQSFSSAPIVINDVVFDGTNEGNIYEYAGNTGILLATTALGTAIDYPDEQDVMNPLTGLAAGDGLLAVPAGTTLTVYSVTGTPEPCALALLAAGSLVLLNGGRNRRRLRDNRWAPTTDLGRGS